MQTLRTRYSEALTRQGWTRNTTARTRRYHEFTHEGVWWNYYLGKGGALRCGSSASRSKSCDPRHAAALLDTIAPQDLGLDFT